MKAVNTQKKKKTHQKTQIWNKPLNSEELSAFFFFFYYIYPITTFNFPYQPKEKLETATSNFCLNYRDEFPKLNSQTQRAQTRGWEWGGGRSTTQGPDTNTPFLTTSESILSTVKDLHQEESQNCSKTHTVVHLDISRTQSWKRWALAAVQRKRGNKLNKVPAEGSPNRGGSAGRNEAITPGHCPILEYWERGREAVRQLGVQAPKRSEALPGEKVLKGHWASILKELQAASCGHWHKLLGRQGATNSWWLRVRRRFLTTRALQKMQRVGWRAGSSPYHQRFTQGGEVPFDRQAREETKYWVGSWATWMLSPSNQQASMIWLTTKYLPFLWSVHYSNTTVLETWFPRRHDTLFHGAQGVFHKNVFSIPIFNRISITLIMAVLCVST